MRRKRDIKLLLHKAQCCFYFGKKKKWERKVYDDGGSGNIFCVGEIRLDCLVCFSSLVCECCWRKRISRRKLPCVKYILINFFFALHNLEKKYTRIYSSSFLTFLSWSPRPYILLSNYVKICLKGYDPIEFEISYPSGLFSRYSFTFLSKKKKKNPRRLHLKQSFLPS